VRVLIAGSSGLVGSSLLKTFEKNGSEVFGLRKSDVDLTNRSQTLNVMQELKPSIVVNAAAKVGGIAINDAMPVDFLTDNLRIQNNLMEASHQVQVKKFIHLGSSCIYPRNSLQPIKEEYLLSGQLEATNSAYAIAKIAGIELVNAYRKQYGRKWISLMPSNLYGPHDNFNLHSAHVLPALIRRFLDATANGITNITLWGSGLPRREFLHVDDFAEAVVLMSEKYDSGVHLNVGTGTDISIRELAIKIATLVGYTGSIEWDTSKPDGTHAKLLDVSRINNLGWYPKITLDEGIKSTISWYTEAEIRGEVRK
jgi:GDP-L-fucose synthase